MTARAIKMAAQASAKIALLMTVNGSVEPNARFVREAADRFPDLLFILPHTGGYAGNSSRGDAALEPELTNVLVAGHLVAPAANDPPEGHMPGLGGLADVAVPAPWVDPPAWMCDWGCGYMPINANLAAANLAAWAVRIAAVEPELKGAGLKSRILKFALPFSDKSMTTRYGRMPRFSDEPREKR